MSRLLLDTCTLIHWAVDPSRIATNARAAIGDGRSFVYVSAASTWEVAIKQRIGKLGPIGNLEQLLADNRFEPLPISLHHTVATLELPMLHRDPFDRLLVAQALYENFQLVTQDRMIQQYDVSILAA